MHSVIVSFSIFKIKCQVLEVILLHLVITSLSLIVVKGNGEKYESHITEI